MQHEALGEFGGIEHFNPLFVVLGAEGAGNERLRLAAGEERGTVGAGQKADLAVNIANFVKRAAIGTAAGLQHFVAENLFLQVIENAAGFGALLYGEGGFGFGVQRVDAGIRIDLLVLLGVHRIGEVGPDHGIDLAQHLLINGRGDELVLRLAAEPH